MPSTADQQSREFLSYTSIPVASRSFDHKLIGGLLLAYLVLISFGYGQLRHPETMMEGEELNYDRSTFLAVNAATLTGFQQAVGIDEFRPDSYRGRATVLVLMVGGVLFTTIVGGLAIVRILQLPYSSGQVITAAIFSLLMAILIGTAGMISPDRGLFDSVFQSVAAYGNCGLATGHVGTTADPRTHFLLMLSVAGGLGLPVLMELFDRIFAKRSLCFHTRAVLMISAIIYLVGFLLLLLTQGAAMGKSSWPAWQQTLASSSVESLNTRTAGMHFEMIGNLPRAAQWVLVGLMVIGASPGGTAGGLKGTTIARLFCGGRDILVGKPVDRSFGIALAWTALYAVIVGTFLLGLATLDQELPSDRQLFVIVSAASNVGLSHDTLTMVGSPLYLLSALMLIGRLAPLAILWWMAETSDGAEMAIG